MQVTAGRYWPKNPVRQVFFVAKYYIIFLLSVKNEKVVGGTTIVPDCVLPALRCDGRPDTILIKCRFLSKKFCRGTHLLSDRIFFLVDLFEVMIGDDELESCSTPFFSYKNV